MKTTSMAQIKTNLANLGKDEVILDVRGADEFQEARVPGSINIPYDQVQNHLDKLRTYRTIYVHCKSGRRAQVAVQALEKAGLKNLVCVADGGILDWLSAGYPVDKG